MSIFNHVMDIKIFFLTKKKKTPLITERPRVFK